MEISIHPLQESSVKLLRALYVDKNLPITPAMLSILNGYYPSIESILGTLKHYKCEDLVGEFIRENENKISDAESEQRKTNSSKEGQADIPNNSVDKADVGSIFDSKFEFINPYKCIKKIALEDIEKALSGELSRICGEELTLEIESIQENVESFGHNAELKVRVKSKCVFK